MLLGRILFYVQLQRSMRITDNLKFSTTSARVGSDQPAVSYSDHSRTMVFMAKKSDKLKKNENRLIKRDINID